MEGIRQAIFIFFWRAPRQLPQAPNTAMIKYRRSKEKAPLPQGPRGAFPYRNKVLRNRTFHRRIARMRLPDTAQCFQPKKRGWLKPPSQYCVTLPVSGSQDTLLTMTGQFPSTTHQNGTSSMPLASDGNAGPRSSSCCAGCCP